MCQIVWLELRLYAYCLLAIANFYLFEGMGKNSQIKKLRAGGMGKVKIGKTLGIGTSAVQRVLTES
ncbi:MAG: hypothetical protein PHG00_17185 [Methylococcales bacterium]|nr:hypothetical protein [Methylococcales bacterium]